MSRLVGSIHGKVVLLLNFPQILPSKTSTEHSKAVELKYCQDTVSVLTSTLALLAFALGLVLFQVIVPSEFVKIKLLFFRKKYFLLRSGTIHK